jgi:hypothetical protein
MVTSMPAVTGGTVFAIIAVLMDCVFFIMTVQMLAPMRMKRLPMMEKVVEAKKVNADFATPLCTGLIFVMCGWSVHAR